MTRQHSELRSEAQALSICIPLSADFQRRQIYERVVGRGPEIVDRPDSASLEKFHQLLIETLGEAQVESLEELQRELKGNDQLDTTARFIGILLRDPTAGDEIASGVYGSVQDGVLAIRFLVTVQDKEQQRDYRGTGISQEICRLFVAEANRWSVSQQRKAIWACVGECVDQSEAFFNRLLGMRRLYVPDPAGAALREIHYELPHLYEWHRDGTPLDPVRSPVLAHLQVAAAGYAGSLPFAELEQLITAFWRAWYVLAKNEFDSPMTWEKHYQLVIEETLQRRILDPLRPHEKQLLLLSQVERNERRATGQVIHDLQTQEPTIGVDEQSS